MIFGAGMRIVLIVIEPESSSFQSKVDVHRMGMVLILVSNNAVSPYRHRSKEERSRYHRRKRKKTERRERKEEEEKQKIEIPEKAQKFIHEFL